MPNSKNTYHCIVSECNQNFVTEYDVTVSKENTNKVDTVTPKLNVDNDVVENSDALSKVDNNASNKISVGEKFLYYTTLSLVFLTISFVICLIFIVSSYFDSGIDPNSNIILAIFFMFTMLILLVILFINLMNKKNEKAFPEINASYASFFIYVFSLSVVFGCIITASKGLEQFEITLPINCIFALFCTFSFIWILINICKAAKSVNHKEYEEKINRVIQFCISVLTIIGVFIGKIEDYKAGNITICLYSFSLIIYLFSPFVISKCVDIVMNQS